MKRHSPYRNVPAELVLAELDRHATMSVDLDGVRRRYINGVGLTPYHQRVIRRYRSGAVRSLRPETARQILNYFNLSL